jgi:peptide/nickel transport system permease protein
MLRYVARRLALLGLVLVGMSLITFTLTHLVPGDPARLLAGPRANAAQVAAIAERYGLDRPLPEQYLTYMAGLLEGDFGQSLTTRRPVLADLRERLPASMELTLAAMLLVVLIGLPLGVIGAVTRGRALDHAIRIFTIAGVSMPIFWLGLAVQIVFYKWFAVLPVGGRLGILDVIPAEVTGLYLIDTLLAGDLQTFRSALAHLILPATTLAVGSAAVITRMMRASCIEGLEADHVRAARAKGLPESVVLYRHVLRNAMIPTSTVLGLQFGFLLSGNVLAEVVFNWPGIGLYAVTAIRYLDYAAIMGVTLIVSFVYVLVNLMVDIGYALLDPRITYRGTAPERA